MANPEHLKILKQGVKGWNAWRKKHSEIVPDLTRADFSWTNLTGVHLHWADLTQANFTGANLTEADLTEVNLNMADLFETNLEGANLAGTIFAFTDLSTVRGIEACAHRGPSSLCTHTLLRSKILPDIFLRGCGLSDWEIEASKLYDSALTNDQIIDIHQRIFDIRFNGAPLQFQSVFISYSSKDKKFAQKIESDLQNAGVRCYFAEKDLPIGKKIRSGLNEAIQTHDRTLLILSKDSIKSHWVKTEIENALEKEEQENREILFPIRIDEEPLKTLDPLLKYIRRTTNIGNFANWKDPTAYKGILVRLLRDLQR